MIGAAERSATRLLLPGFGAPNAGVWRLARLAAVVLAFWAVFALNPAFAERGGGDARPPKVSGGKRMQPLFASKLPKIRVARNQLGFVKEDGSAFVPFGVNYFRPGTGWAPQVWKQFDPDAVRRDFQLLKSYGANCVRVFLSFGSFYEKPGVLSEDGLRKFDQFLKLADEAGLYVHPTGPDHWEGLPEWARRDRIASEEILQALEAFWRLFAARYRGVKTIFAYDLRNEPEVEWDNPTMRERWKQWVKKQYGTAEKAASAWGMDVNSVRIDDPPVPKPEDKPMDRLLLDYQRFREDVADEWTRRQVEAIKSADPDALVTVGFIQWSVPALLPGIRHYAAFSPMRQARFLDFLEIHFYPLERGMYQYQSEEEKNRNLAYLESVVREVARAGKPVVIAEFGWYGGGSVSQGGSKTKAASEEDQADWCSSLIEVTKGLACGWLNWGMYDHPEAGDVSQLTGLFTDQGKEKAWGRRFKELAAELTRKPLVRTKLGNRPELDWDRCITSTKEGAEFRERYYKAFISDKKTGPG